MRSVHLFCKTLGFCQTEGIFDKALWRKLTTQRPVLPPVFTVGAAAMSGHSRPSKKAVCHYGPTNTFTVSSPIGEITIVSCPKGLHQITQSEKLTDKDFKPDISHKVKLVSQLYKDNGYTYSPALQCLTWLQNYFSRERNETVPAFCPSMISDGTFTGKAWLALIDAAPFGTTISYKELSTAAGNSNAPRAAGQAMANNPFMLVIPCHRVIKSGGDLGNYAHGRRNSVKQWLQQFEKGEM